MRSRTSLRWYVCAGSHEVVQAAEHAFFSCNIVPSVKLIADIPTRQNAHHPSQWYAGTVVVIAKDAVMHPSNPWLHAAEGWQALMDLFRLDVRVRAGIIQLGTTCANKLMRVIPDCALQVNADF